jgi:hypothetical protein
MRTAERNNRNGLYDKPTWKKESSLEWNTVSLMPRRIAINFTPLAPQGFETWKERQQEQKKTDILEITSVAPPPSRVYDPTHNFFLNLFDFISHFCQVGKASKQAVVARLPTPINQKKQKDGRWEPVPTIMT